MRRRSAIKRQVIPDVRYNSELVARLINTVMQRGKKSVAKNIVYGAFDIIKERKADQEVMEVFLQAMENIKPRLQVKSRRVGGATYQVPMDVRPEQQVAIALRWLKQYSKQKKGMPMRQALANELMDAFDNTGGAVKKRDDVHKMAAANKAFAHFRF